MHYSYVSITPSKTYAAEVAVLFNELLKGSTALLIAPLLTKPHTDRTRIATTPVTTAPGAEYTLLAKSKRAVAAASLSSLVRSTSRLIGRFRRLGGEVLSPDCWKLSIQEIVHVIQNNLQFAAASNFGHGDVPSDVPDEDFHHGRVQRPDIEEAVKHREMAQSVGLAIGVGVVQV